jgi:hypothetical protein
MSFSYTPIPGDVVLMQNVAVRGAQTAFMNTHWLTTANPGALTLQNIAQLFYAGLATTTNGWMASDATDYGVAATKIWPLPRSQLSGSTGASRAGLSGAISLPTQTCGIISLFDGGTGPGHRGRVYLFFPSASMNQTPGIPTAAFQTLGNIFGTLISSSITLGALGVTWTGVPVLWHSKSRTTTQIQSYLYRGAWGTQRKRGSFGRPNNPPF